MQNIVLFENENHKFVLLNENEGSAEKGLPSNQYLIQHKNSGVLLDPGGFGVMPQVLVEMFHYLEPENIKGIFLSHQDPDIVGGISTWMEMTPAKVYAPEIWLRFLPHYGITNMKRFTGVPDEGGKYKIAAGFELDIIPAHFLHSPGQINVYDPVSKILFSGDIGAAIVQNRKVKEFVDDFGEHVPCIESFHVRYMASGKALRHWVKTVSKLDIKMIAPQHGPVYRGKAVKDFFKWLNGLKCGVDLL